VAAFDILSALMLSTCGTKGACHDSQVHPWMWPWCKSGVQGRRRSGGAAGVGSKS